MRVLRKFLELNPDDRLLLLEAWFSLGMARLRLLSVPFKRIARGLGRRLAPDEMAPAAEAASPMAWKICRAVERASRYTPWNSTCLTQTIAGKSMLRRRGLASRLYLGTRKDQGGQLLAHSWLLVGNEVLIGGMGHESFTPLGAFDDRSSERSASPR